MDAKEGKVYSPYIRQPHFRGTVQTTTPVTVPIMALNTAQGTAQALGSDQGMVQVSDLVQVTNKLLPGLSFVFLFIFKMVLATVFKNKNKE